MSLRNKLFTLYNQYYSAVTLCNRYLPLRQSYNNKYLMSRAETHNVLEGAAKYAENHTNIIRAKMDEFEKLKFDIVEKYKNEGRNDPSVDPEDVLHSIDRIEVLRKLKIIETDPQLFSAEEVKCWKLIGRVHLEEPKQLIIIAKSITRVGCLLRIEPTYEKYQYLGQI